MTVPMDSSLGLSSRERVQYLYNQNVKLESERRSAAQARVPSEPNTWQQIRENYEAILLEDHAFSEEHDVEYALWQLHYRRIDEFRALLNTDLAANSSVAAKDEKSTARPGRVAKIRSQMKNFLSEATGFYLDLMLKIRAKYGLPLGFFLEDPENSIVISKDEKKFADIKKGLMSCHRCLIYLGDLSRYKGLYGESDSKSRDFSAASSYYTQASSLCPSSGNPHHQLAILASYSGDELVAIYRYFRSLAVENPFSTARDNLIIAFEKNRQTFSQLRGDGKASTTKIPSVRMAGKGRGKVGAKPPRKDNTRERSFVKDSASSIADTFKAFCIRFVRLNGILFTRTSLETFGDVLSCVRSDLLELLSTGKEDSYNFCPDAAENGLVLVRLITILIFTIHNAYWESKIQSHAESLQRSVVLQSAYAANFEFVGHILDRCMQLKDPSASFLLPSVLVFVEWLACNPDIVSDCKVEGLEIKQDGARSFFWKNWVLFLNKILASGIYISEDEDASCFVNMSSYDESETANRLALWEDFELRGCLPLLPAQRVLDFSRKLSLGSDGADKEKKARVQRIIAAGKALTGIVQVGQKHLYFDPMQKKFIIGAEPQISGGLGLHNFLEIPTPDGVSRETPVDGKNDLGVLMGNADIDTEGEEDEVIVFKPLVTDKHLNAAASELSSYNIIAAGETTSVDGFEKCTGSFSAETTSVDGFDRCIGPVGVPRQNLFDASIGPPTCCNIAPQHLQAIPTTLKWLQEQNSVAIGLNKLNLMDCGLAVKPGSQEHHGVLQPAAVSLPPTQSIDLNSGSEHFGQVSDVVTPTKYNSALPSGASFSGLPLKSSCTSVTSTDNNLVNRPARHVGPPPGFSAALKLPDHSLAGNGMTLKNENPKMDDCSWLDGYQFQPPVQGPGFDYIKCLAQSYHSRSDNNNLKGTIGFPFPGKQVPSFRAQMENQKIWHNYDYPDHLKPYQRQQIQKMNHASIPLLEQYQGNSGKVTSIHEMSF